MLEGTSTCLEGSGDAVREPVAVVMADGNAILEMLGVDDKTVSSFKANGVASEEGDVGEDSQSPKIEFFPPLGIQRYSYVAKVVSDLACESVVDLGAGGQVRLLHWMKHVSSLRSYYAVEIDKNDLYTDAPRAHKTIDYLNPDRGRPLDVEILHGSIFDVLKGLDVDCAVMIEVIEHVTGTATLTDKVFGTLKPKYAVVTTPNSEFNVCFSRTGFRHPDHKFEWTRSEFQQWCENVRTQYGYTYSIDGLGSLPEIECGRDIGYCTQLAVFTRACGALVSAPFIARKRAFGRPEAWTPLFRFTLPAQPSLKMLSSSLSRNIRESDDCTEWRAIKALRKRGPVANLGPISFLCLLALQNKCELSSDLSSFNYKADK